MNWVKRGLVFTPDGQSSWAKTNATFPTAELLNEERIRIYYTALDKAEVGRTGYIDVSPDDPSRVLNAPCDPVLDCGEPGSFDESGANVTSVVNYNERKLLYYQGWQRTGVAPYLVFTGLAFGSTDGNSNLKKHSRVPLLDRNEEELSMRAAPFVIIQGDSLWMWYASNREWSRGPDALHYDVAIRHARSKDGIHWQVHPKTSLEPNSAAGEYAVGRPSVLFDGKTYQIWFSVRSFRTPYRLGYAESNDGVHWERRDDLVSIRRSKEGWDSEMICYPNVINVGSKKYMFYNGNQHGKTGFGYAVQS